MYLDCHTTPAEVVVIDGLLITKVCQGECNRMGDYEWITQTLKYAFKFTKMKSLALILPF